MIHVYGGTNLNELFRFINNLDISSKSTVKLERILDDLIQLNERIDKPNHPLLGEPENK